VESDPIGLASGVNTYAYANLNPVSNVDPFGEAAITIPFPNLPIPDWVAVPGARALGALGLILSLSGDTPQQCSTGDSDKCKAAIADAESAHWDLTTKRIPQYTSSATPTAGHYQAILQKQSALKEAIRKVKLWCRPLPPQLPEWERVANLPIPSRH
jgi:uncharacterized protein RhaS with RHS repeats